MCKKSPRTVYRIQTILLGQVHLDWYYRLRSETSQVERPQVLDMSFHCAKWPLWLLLVSYLQQKLVFIPWIPKDHSAFRNVITSIFIVLRCHMRNRCHNGLLLLRLKHYGASCSPRGVTGCHRKSSFTIAWMYGMFSTSANSGSLSLPTTSSIWAWAFAMTSGYIFIAKKNANKLDTV